MPENLYPLVVLACPIGMGLMMWMMMRGSGKKPIDPTPSESDEIVLLRKEVEHLRASQTDPTDTNAGAKQR